ncbi:hypothetical protein AJ932_08455 [Campylobacter sp. BCW_6873]|nr:hypothetical protein AJ932_08455 [Campylobacter sp. BCW_6873]
MSLSFCINILLSIFAYLHNLVKKIYIGIIKNIKFKIFHHWNCLYVSITRLTITYGTNGATISVIKNVAILYGVAPCPIDPASNVKRKQAIR